LSTPTHDIIPRVTDKYKDVLGISSENVALILYGLEKELSINDIYIQKSILLES